MLLLVPAGLLEASNKRGDKFFKLGEQAEAKKDFDKALEYFQKAVEQDQREPTYEVAMRRARFEAGQVHVDAGMKLKKENQLQPALVEFQKAFATDPASMIAVQEIKEITDALDLQKKGKVPAGDAGLTPVELAQKRSLEMIQSLQPVPELKPVSNQITSLKMNNQPPKVLYETVGKLAGINVLFDPQMQPGKNANLDLSNVTLEEALDYIGLLTKTFWKPVSSNAIFVTEDNVTKRRDYEDEVVKVFYLRNPTSVQEFQEIVTGVRSVSDVRRMFTFNAQNAVMVRDTVDKVNLVEKLLHDMDKPKSEVVVDVIVMDVSSDRSHSIAAGLVSNGTTGLAVPVTFTGNNTSNTTTTTTTTTTTSSTAAAGSIALSQLGHLSTNEFSTTLPGALLQAVMADSSTKVMQSPEVRASDGQKVTLKIGEKYPYATGSFQPGVGTVGVSPLVSTQFQFVDVGVNVELTPHVHGTDEVTLHVSVDISDIASTVNLGGLSQPVIAQKKDEADIRLRDGEVSVLGGLMQTQDTSSVNGIPGLVNIPILGKYLFGSTSTDKQKEELMIALIPHIVRKADVNALDLKGIAAGTDQTVKLSYAERPEEPAAAPAATAPTAPTTTPAAPASPAPSAAVTPAVPGGATGLAFAPATLQTQLGNTVVLTLQASNMTDLSGVPVKIAWDPKVLRLEKITAGALLIQDGNVTAPTVDIRNDTGDASVDINRTAGASGVNGTGPLMHYTFTAVGKGSTTVKVTDVQLKNSKKEPLTVTAPMTTVTVQ